MRLAVGVKGDEEEVAAEMLLHVVVVDAELHDKTPVVERDERGYLSTEREATDRTRARLSNR